MTSKQLEEALDAVSKLAVFYHDHARGHTLEGFAMNAILDLKAAEHLERITKKEWLWKES